MLSSLKQILGETSNHRVAIYGPGGVGKTEVAREFCHRYKQDYKFVFWVNAVDRPQLLLDFCKIADTVGWSEKHEPVTKNVMTGFLFGWFRKNRNWLLVIDNVSKLSAVQDVLPESVDQNGHILLTTRDSNFEAVLGQGYELGPLNTTDSVQLLLGRANLSTSAGGSRVQQEASLIVNDLGYLPLAIVQAAALISNSHSIFEFRENYQRHAIEFVGWSDFDSSLYSKSAATLWSMFSDVLTRDHPAAISLLQLFAFLDPSGILVEFLEAGVSGLRSELRALVSDGPVFQSALLALEKCCLIKLSDNRQEIHMHPLVQGVVRDNLDETQKMANATDAISLSLSVFTDELIDNDREACRKYRRQVTSILEHIESTQVSDWHIPGGRLAKYLGADAFYNECFGLISAVVEAREEVLGEEHPLTLQALNSLGSAYFNIKNYSDAADIYREVMEAAIRSLEPENPDIILYLNNLAHAYHNIGRVTEASELHREAFETAKRVLGEDHPETVRSMELLAMTHYSLTQLKESILLFREVLQIRLTLYGPTHPDTLRSKAHLASSYCNFGWYTQELQRDARNKLQSSIHELGLNDPETLRCRYTVAAMCNRSGRSEEAETLYNDVLRGRIEALGPQHAETLQCMDALAETYGRLGRWDDAIRLYERIAELRGTGEQYQYRLKNMSCLARCYERIGDKERAIQLHAETLEAQRNVLGSSHLETLKSMSYLAALFRNVGRSEALRLHQEMLQLRINIELPEELEIPFFFNIRIGGLYTEEDCNLNF